MRVSEANKVLRLKITFVASKMFKKMCVRVEIVNLGLQGVDMFILGLVRVEMLNLGTVRFETINLGLLRFEMLNL